MPAIRPLPIVPMVQFDAQLVRRWGKPGSCYASFPTAGHFRDDFGYRDYLRAVAGLRTRGGAKPLAIYLHIPFCEAACRSCDDNRIVTKQRDKATVYLSYLKREIDMQGMLFAAFNRVEQLHLGGGTPTHLSDAQMGELMAYLRRKFEFAPDEVGDYLIELDPRTVSPERVHSLRRQGFNRIHLGMRDCGEHVQPEAQTPAIIGAAREAGFRSVSIDLIYGLPQQDVVGLARTLSKLIQADPDRIGLHDAANLPHLFKPQRRSRDAGLSSADARLDMLELCIRRLTEAGYACIGMDHFARLDDELAVAQRQGRLHRNLLGYSTHADMALVACGMSAVGAAGATYSQNARTLEGYYDRIDRNELPIERGIALTLDDLLRRSVIQMLMCQFELSVGALEQAFPIVFAEYFASELEQLRALAADGLLVIGPEYLSVTLKGRLLIRTICMAFDRYLNVKPAV